MTRRLSNSRTAAAWTSLNPTLMDREIGYELDTGKAKIGDGATAWNSLDYWQVNAPLLTLQRTRCQVAEFLGLTNVANQPFVGTAIAGGASLTQVVIAGMFGALRINSSLNANSGYRWQTLTQFESAVGLYWRGIFSWTGGFSNVTVRAGWHDTQDHNDAVDGIYFEAVGDQLVLKVSSNSSQDSASAWTIPAQNTPYVFEFLQVSTTEVMLLISDASMTLLDTRTISGSSNVPATSARSFFSGVVATHSGTTIRNIFIVDQMALGLERDIAA